jgi:cell wall-associated NlpC family hydrolase
MGIDRYVGIPYLDKGRTQVGCDCWGLVHLVYRELLRIDLPSYCECYGSADDGVAISGLIADELEPWGEIAPGEEMQFDGVLMRDGAVVRHIGIVAQPGLLLHVEPTGLSKIERYRTGILRNRIVGFYRYRPAE